jgi:hypothetical protein
MSDNQNPWLKAAININELLKQEPPEVQQAIKQMNQKIYPQTWEAIREKEQQQQ